jgi:EmrB/QacA subfamily drug resistance transporter
MNVTPETQSGAAKPVRERLDPAVVKLIVVLLTGAIPSLLDTSIVNVAVDTIGRDLHTTVSTIQWVITGYLLSLAMVIPLSGWALARFGGRAVWMFSLTLFLAGSVACGASWNIGSLITFRVIQGIGGGLLTPLITTLLVQAAGGKNLGRLMAAVSLPVVVVPIFGPVVAGLIISNISWRWIFYVNVPMCLLGLVLAWRGLPTSRPPGGASRIDVAGLVLLPPALVALLYGLAEVSTAGGFGHRTVLIPLAAGVVLLAAYCWHALHTSVTPMVDLRLFRARAFTGATTLLFLAGLSIYGAMLLLPLYFQVVRHDSALVAGLLMVPQGLGSIAPRTLAGKLTDRIGPRLVVLAGVVLSAIGTIPFALAGLHTNYWLLGAALVVRGAGLGTATIAVMAGAFHGLSREQVPHASSATRIVQFVGGSFGAAVLVAAILDRQVVAHAAAGAAGLATAYANTFWWCTGFTALALVPALLLSGRAKTPANS